MKTNNLSRNIPGFFRDEVFEKLLSTEHFKLERILSRGHRTAEGQWYEQEKNEWVMIFQGSAVLRIEGEEQLLTLTKGDYVLLPARLRHRVEKTDEGEETIWLALHF